LYGRAVPKVLVAWIGRADFRARTEEAVVGSGPVAQALQVREFAKAVLLSDFSERETTEYLAWLRARTTTPIEVVYERLSAPTAHGEIHEAALRGVEHALSGAVADTSLCFHLSPGTPAMHAVWLLLGKTRYPSAELIESSKDHGLHTVDVPFDISADFLPDLLRERDERLRQGSAAEPPAAPEFADIIHRGKLMTRVVQRARRVAVRNVPVLIEGESGTGKEMLARAIHRASLRSERDFVPINCGAIPAALVESELFGHEKGAFTDAKQARVGCFEAAHRGTLFLDEVGELPSAVQVKLLRTIQEGEIVRVGATKPIKVDVRLVAATNRTLTDEIAAGRFREDLFYRLAVAVLKLPALRERSGDLGLLIDHALDQVNREAVAEPGYKEKKLSAAGRNLLLAHRWPGNVRELVNTLRRAAIWSDGSTISADDAREALLPVTGNGIQDRPLGDGFNLPNLLRDVARHYLSRAMEEAEGNKTKAAKLVGLSSYQTLTNWLGRYEVET
jgi:DNA-binding NtrC family response regulator